MTVSRIKMWILGTRDYPEALVTLPRHIVADLPDLVQRARALTPGVSVQSIVYTLWSLGTQRLDQSLRRRIPVRAAQVPHASRESNETDETVQSRPSFPV